MKILLLTHKFWPDVGGIESISEMLAERFVAEGHIVRVVTWSEDASSTIFSYDVIRKPTVTTLFKQHKWADVVFENNICLRLSWPALVLLKAKVIGLQTWIQDQNSPNKLQGLLKKQWLKKASAVIACSEAIRKGCWPKAQVIGNPYQQRLFKIVPEADRVYDFVFVGRLVSDKGVDIAIMAVAQLVKIMAYKKVVLNIIGDGPEKANLQKMVDESGLQHNVKLLGAYHGVALVQCLNKHRFILVPSTWQEPFGIVALEGMACGCLPIVANTGGLPDAVGSSGLTFKAGDSTSLFNTMQRILVDDHLENVLRGTAANHLRQNTAVEISKRYLSVFNEAAK